MSTTNTAKLGPNFETWRQAINEHIESSKKYKKLAEMLGLTQAAAELEAGFNNVVEEHLRGVDSPTMARDIRHAIEFSHDICGDPWRAAFASWLKNDPATTSLITQAVHNPDSFSYHGFIGDLTEAFGQALAAKGEHAVISPFYRPDAPDAVQYKTRLADGTWLDISEESLLACMRNSQGPHIVHCANHAFFENENFDLSKLQDAFTTLFKGSRLPVVEEEGHESTGQLSTWDVNALGANDTITIFTTHTRENRFLNLGQLFHRLDAIDRAQAHPEADKFEHVAPIATDMVETLLKSIVVDADISKVHPVKVDGGKPIFFDGPVTLRPDALEILRRQRYRGFSKGGNDFRDGMRLLVHTLEAKNADGEPLVNSPGGLTTQELISNISIIVFGLNEKPMAQYYRDHGVYVPIVSSKNDIVAPIPPFLHEEREPVFNYAGNDAGAGHSPQYAVDGMLADWRIHDLLRMAGAVSQGQAAITDIKLLPDGDGYNPNTLMLEVAPGTTDAMMVGCIESLNSAMRNAGLRDTTLKRMGGDQRPTRYSLVNNDSATELVSPENIAKVAGVFRSLCAQCGPKAAAAPAAPPVTGLWVSQAAAYGKMSLIKRHLLDEQQGKHGPDSVIDKASLISYVRADNKRGVRKHPLTERNLDHERIPVEKSAANLSL